MALSKLGVLGVITATKVVVNVVKDAIDDARR